jgi:PEP-CTERM motif
MKKLRLFLGFVPAFVTIAGSAQQTITFDNLPSSAASPITNGYAGFQWTGFEYMDSRNEPGTGFANGTVSLYNIAFNQGGNPANFSSSIPFTLESADLTGAWNNGLHVEVQGFMGATLAYDHTYTVNATGPTLINFNFTGVNEVNLISSGGTSAGYAGVGTEFVMDNLIVAVPEPGTWALFGLGLGAMGIIMAMM